MSGEGGLRDRWQRLLTSEQRLDALEASNGGLDVSAGDDGLKLVGNQLRMDIENLPLAPEN